MKVAIIGAGVSGLVSLKSCKEAEFRVTCYEMTNDIGGLWRYHEDDVNELGSVYKSTIMNTSKELSAFSDFPPPSYYPNYMPHKFALNYYRLYANKYSLLQHILFNHKVLSLLPNDDYEDTGKWKLIVRDSTTNTEKEDIFDAVMICTGHHTFPRMPYFAGMENFKGTKTHVHRYREPSKYKKRNVLIIGSGNSAMDVAVDLATVAKTVYMNSRSGEWMIPRLGFKGHPFDSIYRTRFCFLLISLLPTFIINIFMEFIANARFDHSLYNLKPERGFFNAHPSTNDILPFFILGGLVHVKRNIARITSEGVMFSGENKVTRIDDIIFATGYEIRHPFLDKDVVNLKEGLYKEILPSRLKHNTLAFIGLIQIVGSLVPVSEIQSRWFVQLLKGNVQLPSQNNMLEWIQNAREARIKRFGHSTRYSLEISEGYLDELADDIGAKPDFLNMLLRDQKLFWACTIGPCLPYQFRIQGPHSWFGARDAILNYEKQLRSPLVKFRTRGRSDKIYSQNCSIL